MGIRDWLAIIVIIFIVLILLDGFRRKWLERKNRIVVKLDKSIPPTASDDEDVLIKSELPNGGARTLKRHGDREDVPVLVESVDLADEEIEEYPVNPDDDDAGLMAQADVVAGTLSLDDDPDADLERAPADSVTGEDDRFIADDQGDDPEDEGSGEDDAVANAADDAPDDELAAGDDDPWAATGRDDDNSATAAADRPAAAVAEDAAASEPRAAKRGFLKGRGKADERIEPTFGNDDLTFSRDDQGELDLEHNDLFDSGDEGGDEEDHQDAAEEVIIINVMARPNTVLEGSRMLPVLLKQGMRLGDMSIFHRHADASGKGPVMFSMANMVKPGTFALSEMDTFTTPGVSFFMQLPNKVGNMQCFEQMLKTAEAIKHELDAQLKDENRSVFTRQTIEHSRQRIRDFELQMLARK